MAPGLEGKVAIVTGAARHRGIGRAIAMRLADDGAHIVAVGSSRAAEDFPEDEKSIGWRGVHSVLEDVHALGRDGLAMDADLTQPADAERIVDETMAKFGRIDILVNNAGLAFCGEKNLWEIPDDEWYRVIDVNLNGVYLLTSRALRRMVEAGNGGRIVNISSSAGRMGVPQYGAYCATKWGIVGLTQMIALEAAPHRITVNCVAPGSVDTDMMDGTFRHMASRFGSEAAQMKQLVVRTIALGRQGRPDDIAGAVAFFASEDAAWITGQTLNVNGGTPMS
ncbi:MAG TPA: SDR family NAD(P)-dependent oxidoreductase [Dehalococcoidia bacterium]|jgi:3-oxoacyl-[acyl-carrier protein] reductase/meso-butanediol dehydrogenase/(S,S)-butanediol dehydrogenase/diacetyl reductase|nr:SDR family NAD(P)-dependent oxidoreductase [Dehalococcoidia bacterium]